MERMKYNNKGTDQHKIGYWSIAFFQNIVNKLLNEAVPYPAWIFTHTTLQKQQNINFMALLCNRDIHVYKHHTGLKGLFFLLNGGYKETCTNGNNEIQQ
jgi:hypothetical protein